MSRLYDTCFKSLCVDPTARCQAVEDYKITCLKVGVTVSPPVKGCGGVTPSITKPPPSVKPTVTGPVTSAPTGDEVTPSVITGDELTPSGITTRQQPTTPRPSSNPTVVTSTEKGIVQPAWNATTIGGTSFTTLGTRPTQSSRPNDEIGPDVPGN